MKDLKLGQVESHFADIIWQHEPLSTSELIKLSAAELNWKRTTTYTVLKRLCERGIFQMENSVVTSLISHDEFYSIQSENFVNETFHGSLPAFLTAFTARKRLSKEDLSELHRMIDAYKEEE